MSQLDQALEKFLADETQQEQYYELILHTDFYIPLTDQNNAPELSQQQEVTPLILESDDKPYLMLFDSEERLAAWAKRKINFTILTGANIVKFSPESLNWAVNIGGHFSKEIVPEEIQWLKSMLLEKEDTEE